MTRLIAGAWGGRRLVTPDGRDTRPTSDRVREALFSTLSTMVDLAGARVADLYAGSGAVGLEAASRGASHVLLVEAEAKAARAARANIAALGAGAAVTLATAKVELAVAAGPGGPYDVIFADPPYGLGDDDLAAVLAALAANGWLGEDAVLVVERATRSAEPKWPAGVTAGRSRRYGETTLWYGRRS
jgi:16S rRNA (guanine(966)-N(2))-methyltransferase RsmD